MTISRLERPNQRTQLPVCSHCGRSIDLPASPSIVETGLGVLAALVLALMLVPVSILTLKACEDFVSETGSRSILYHPLEDWPQH
jgi:hypothetical protein